jgi:hypothetical protein
MWGFHASVLPTMSFESCESFQPEPRCARLVVDNVLDDAVMSSNIAA